MCGRARCTLRPEDVPRACGVANGSIPTVDMDRYCPSFNVSPGAYLPVVRRDNGSSQGAILHCMKWGLVPNFTKKAEKPDHFRMFNARSESICEKASFRRLVPNNRCLVAVEGFYEWKKDGQKKQPYYIHFKDCRPLVFAALYDSWVNPEGGKLHTFTILTCCCSSSLQWLHDRMPVILGSKGAADAWLNGSASSKFDSLFKPYEDSDLAWCPVTPEMGKLTFDGPECIREIKIMPEEKKISKFFSKTKIDAKHELALKVKSSLEEPAETKPSVSLKEEPDTHEIKDLSSDFEWDKNDWKPEVSSLVNSGDEKCGTKRNYDKLLTSSGMPTDTDIKPSPSLSVKKKGSLQNTADKQPTLLSYFGKC